MKKPVMATKDLRFFDCPHAEVLPDGRPRRGMSVVAALSTWLVHTNRRVNGAWTQRYEHGVPVSGLEVIEADGTTGTLVHFKPDESLAPVPLVEGGDLSRLAAAWPRLEVQIDDRRVRWHGAVARKP
ncbi:hypothetical protein ABTX99_35275 [Streptomyces flaveolus]|uniref:hypothetical protein n=1 Tax=Streptomyces flaveolus TaxID=67297 RepID=UPI00331EAEF0